MNNRKNTDYSGLYDEIDRILAVGFSQMELYLELGRLVSVKPEKGAAVGISGLSGNLAGPRLN